MTTDPERPRFDRADVGAVLGVILIGVGLAQLQTPLLWIWVGASVLLGSVLAVLPPKKQTRDDRPAVPALPHERLHTIGE